MERPKLRICRNCKFFDDSNKDDSPCRVGPPQILPVVRGGRVYGWPIVDETDWCGKWEGKDGENGN